MDPDEDEDWGSIAILIPLELVRKQKVMTAPRECWSAVCGLTKLNATSGSLAHPRTEAVPILGA
jgi:hypothetical protein